MSVTPSPRPGLRPLEDALADLLNDTAALAGVQKVPTFEADGRVLAQDLVSALDVPGHDNTSMDGYAVRVADLAQAAGAPLVVSQRIPAGHFGGPLLPGTVARIFTGAPVPAGADAVVMVAIAQDGMNNLLAQLKSKGIPVVDAINGVTSKDTGVRVLTSPRDEGLRAGQYLAKTLQIEVPKRRTPWLPVVEEAKPVAKGAGKSAPSKAALAWAERQAQHITTQGELQAIRITGAQDDPVQVWLFYPPGFDAKKRYPLLQVIHGGPHTVVGDNWHYRWNNPLFAAGSGKKGDDGHVVAVVNYHGSSSFGHAFLDSITGRWGQLELQDVEPKELPLLQDLSLK